jgi:hypothetical protein
MQRRFLSGFEHVGVRRTVLISCLLGLDSAPVARAQASEETQEVSPMSPFSTVENGSPHWTISATG